MSARAIRRTFAAPLVMITMSGSLAGCHREEPVHANPPPPPADAAPEPVLVPPPEVLHINPPPPQPPIVANPPPPADPARRWRITKSHGKCTVVDPDVCGPRNLGTPIPPCNPPPPQPIACPAEVAEGQSVVITRPQPDTDCFVPPKMPTCPPNTMCNPGPPMRVACPDAKP